MSKNEDILRELVDRYEKLYNSPPFTTIKEINKIDYEGWLYNLKDNRFFKYLIFELREGTIKELEVTDDFTKIQDLRARLAMLRIIVAYVEMRGVKNG